jgi:hypothetical protein
VTKRIKHCIVAGSFYVIDYICSILKDAFSLFGMLTCSDYFFSSVGVIAVVYVVFLIVYQKYMGNFMPGPIKTSPTHWTDIFLVVPVICFGYQVTHSSTPVLQHSPSVIM